MDKTQQKVPVAIKEPSEVVSGRNEFVSSGTEKDQPKKAKSTFVSEVSGSAKFVTPRTVPVIVKKDNRKKKVNALLNDASTETYINADIAAQLGLQGKFQQVTVNVLNGQLKTFDIMPVEFELESLNGLVDMKMSAFTAARVTGNLNVAEWSDFPIFMASNFGELALAQLLTFLLVSIMWTCIILTETYAETLENPLQD